MLTKLKALCQQQGFMHYFKNTSWLLGEKVLRMFVGLFVGIWIARYLGPKQFGLLSYAQSFVFLFAAIVTLGLDGIVVRELVRDESQSDVLLATAFGLKLIGAILILPVLAVAVHFTSNDEYTNLLIFIIASATIFQSFNIIDFYYQSKVLSKYVALANTISLTLSSIIKITLIINNAPLITFAAMVVFDSAILAIGLVFFFKNTSHKKLRICRFDWMMAKRLLNDSWPLILSGVVISVYIKIDHVMIKEMLDVEAVGQYAAAVRLSEAWYFIPVVITRSLFPAIINAKKISEELYYSRLQSLYTLMVWLAIVIALPMTFLSDRLIILLYGMDYSQAGDVLRIHIWAGVFVGLGVSASKWVISENYLKNALIRTTIGAILNILLNYLFIKIMFVQGAAVATLISYFFVNYFSLVFSKKTRVCFFQQTKALYLMRSWKTLW